MSYLLVFNLFILFPNLVKRLRTPREFYFGGQWDLITELPQDWGNRLLEGTNKTACAPGPRRKEPCPHERLSQTCLGVSRSLLTRRGLTVACHGVRSTDFNSPGSCGACWHKSFERGHHYHLRLNCREGTQPLP